MHEDTGMLAQLLPTTKIASFSVLVSTSQGDLVMLRLPNQLVP
jgi:hypothetical protein